MALSFCSKNVVERYIDSSSLEKAAHRIHDILTQAKTGQENPQLLQVVIPSTGVEHGSDFELAPPQESGNADEPRGRDMQAMEDATEMHVPRASECSCWLILRASLLLPLVLIRQRTMRSWEKEKKDARSSSKFASAGEPRASV